MGRFVPPVVLSLFFVVISVLPSEAGGTSCKRCHIDIYNEVQGYLFPHSPVKDNCVKCHIVNGSDRGGSRGSRLFLKGYYAESLLPLEELSEKEKYHIEVVLKDSKGRKSFPVLLPITPSMVEGVLKEDKAPLVIEDIVVDGIKPGIFIEAILKWKTNKPTLFEIEYGLTAKYGERVKGEKNFIKEHTALLTGLRHNRIYHYRIISKDPFGNNTVSEDHTIDTSNSKEVREKKDTDLPPSIEDLKPLRSEDGSIIYLLIKSNTHSNISLKIISETTKTKKHGSGLTTRRFSGIEACVRCHAQGASHPVGILARNPKTRIPDTLPTGEGGVITCVTCHLPHGGMIRYLARFDFQRDICVLCHTDF
ncbi:MAG: cytochrome c3 family protein [Thermodesulfobacteriota bacterium]